MRLLPLICLLAVACAASPLRPDRDPVPCKVVAPDPRYVEVRKLKNEGDFAGALEALLRIEEADGMDQRTRDQIATLHLKLGDSAAARKTWDEWIRKNPDDWAGLRGRGQLLTELRQWEDAAADLAASIEKLSRIEDPARLESLRIALRLWFARAMSEGEKAASEELRKRLPKIEPEQDDGFTIPLARFFAEEISEGELLELAGQAQEGWKVWRRRQTGWAIGLRRLVRGDRDGAREWFRSGLGEEEYGERPQHEVSEMLRLLDTLKENSR
jgi:tetratricopeptide (TPR) repeat protein